jgi:dolichol-phosphate mannosyltransferase
MREYHRFLRGMVAWAGYRTVVLPYAERERIGGRPSYSLRAWARLAANATFSFSLVPLKLRWWWASASCSWPRPRRSTASF